MITKKSVVREEHGIHARPAAIVSRCSSWLEFELYYRAKMIQIC